ncbi:MAG: response regulator [bacterium]
MARLMIIDDDIELADNNAILLRHHGHEVSTLYSTKNAVRKITASKPDLLILDVMFPDNPVGGFDLAREIRNTTAIKELPILLLTGINQEFPMDFSVGDIDTEWMPVQSFAEKPVKITPLLNIIKSLLKKH